MAMADALNRLAAAHKACQHSQTCWRCKVEGGCKAVTRLSGFPAAKFGFQSSGTALDMDRGEL